MQDRLWRDNRNKNAAGVAHCQGVDINRNFDYHWDQREYQMSTYDSHFHEFAIILI